MNLSNTRLKYLYEAAQLGTMRTTSEKLNVATSSISRQLVELEKEISLPLF
ncbi:LysR family transcriptional regulator [Pseudomaricurvus alkylphenolicus]|uniref:LysR family transcriptional regulator n=1 Tax=Pseudomaricurvus alkylphenolicus TaxID=1306991 RepID=UPI00141D8C71|nr:LysR family transcriptional regulator [Pseudomaricurvus alkylphenolicus]NIB40288.1 LysR family transcriptional regulator [Pseudomaricurvus alkylphenolicus]